MELILTHLVCNIQINNVKSVITTLSDGYGFKNKRKKEKNEAI